MSHVQTLDKSNLLTTLQTVQYGVDGSRQVCVDAERRNETG